METMGRRAWQLPQDQFAEAWNGADTLDEAIAAVKLLADGPLPRWAARARASELRHAGVELRHLPPPLPKAS